MLSQKIIDKNNLSILPCISGIYGIRNKITNQIYIGQSINIKQRFNFHLKLLNKNENKSNKVRENDILYNSWNKYGKENFEFIVIEECISNKDILNEKEKFWIAYYGWPDKNRIFNNTNGGDSKKIVSKETCTKISEALKRNNRKMLGVENPSYGKPNRNKNTLKDVVLFNYNESQLNKTGRICKKPFRLYLEVVMDLYYSDMTVENISKKYNLDIKLVSFISHGRHWSVIYALEIIKLSTRQVNLD